MTLHELERILINITLDASTVGNAQYTMIIGATITMLKSAESLCESVRQCPLNDSCRQIMLNKIVEIETFTSNAILMRLAEFGIDISLYTLGDFSPLGRVPAVSQPMMMQQQSIPAVLSVPAAPPAARPASFSISEVEKPKPTQAPVSAPVVSRSGSGSPINLGGMLPGMGGGEFAAEAVGPAYLLKVINGEI